MMKGRYASIAAVVAVLVPVFLIGFGVTALADTTASGAATNAPGTSPQGDPTKGGQLYSQSGCAGCHGAALEGGVGAKLNPIQKLPGVADPLDPGYLVQTITNGRSGDPGFSAAMPVKGGNQALTAQDIQDLAAFIIQSNKAPNQPLSPTDLARSTVFWVTIGVGGMVIVSWLLAVYNMRWIARRARARSGGA